jgi:hypothetical protein
MVLVSGQQLEKENQMSKKLCADCQTRPAVKGTPENMFCDPCNDYAGDENTHSDWAHDDVRTGDTGKMKIADIEMIQNQMKSCAVCHPELDPRNKPVRTGHTNTATHTHTSHAGCSHPRTPKDREICRRARKAQA